ncbi:MAG: hypothetical protein HYX28_06135, partial [Candidatus Koribacter versatilis]|nr:hypothetical protein [Candidatus Koribacter versatilis]
MRLHVVLARLGLLAAFVYLFSAAASAGTFNIFGPVTYVRSTASPQTATAAFNALPGSQYTLHVESDSVASAVVSLNGADVIVPSDMNPHLLVIDKPVQLQALNHLAVELRGAPGGKFTVRILGADNDPPVIVAGVAPAPNAAGWNANNVTVTFSCSDATSGIAQCPPALTVSTEGKNQVITGTAVDLAGNTASTAVSVSIDKTAPIALPSASPAPNANGWTNADTTISFACSDALSGIAGCTAPVLLTQEGTAQTVTGQAIDLADNQSSASLTVSLDKTRPAITSTASPAPNAAGWNNTDVTVSFQCSDTLSGVDQCPQPQSVTADATGQVVTGTATDKAG